MIFYLIEETQKKEEIFMKKFMKFVSAVAAVSLVAAPLAVSADEKTFLLGGSGPLTGAAASYGASVKQTSGSIPDWRH